MLDGGSPRVAPPATQAAGASPDPAGPPRRGSRHPIGLLVLLVGLLVLAACGDSSDDDASSETTAAESTASPETSSEAETPFPVSIPHAFGETTIDDEPERVVTWGWGSADAAVALGVVPAAIPFQAYGGDDSGVLPWIREALDAQGAEVPTVLPNQSEPPFEAIAAAQPDVILAPYSGITDSEYELLSQIAPTVAYPDEPWATPWRDTVTIVGQALGRSDVAEDLLADIDADVAAQAEAHPELAGRTVAQVWPTADAFYVYKPADPRVQFSLDLGLVSADSVDALSTDESTFYFTISTERLGELTSDILVSYAETAEDSQAFLASQPAQLLPQVQQGAVAEIIGAEFIAAVSPPTALSLTWGLAEYAEILAGAAAALES